MKNNIRTVFFKIWETEKLFVWVLSQTYQIIIFREETMLLCFEIIPQHFHVYPTLLPCDYSNYIKDTYKPELVEQKPGNVDVG